jgi:O-antigen/teichoic acid export membrane protein
MNDAAANGGDERISETAALAKGGRLNFFGFLLRLLARLPFLFIAGQLYGAEALGRFAYATMVVELMAALATLGLKRGLAKELSVADRPPSHVIGDGLVLAWVFALFGACIMVALPEIVFPNSKISGLDRIFPLIAICIVGSDVTLAALAYRHKVSATVTARSVIEPWTLTIVAAALAFIPSWKPDAMIIAYAASLGAAFTASVVPCVREFGLPRGWRPHPGRLVQMMRDNLPIAGADAIEWGSRRIDLIMLGQFASPAVLGIYYVAQQVTTLPQKLKVTFDPILAPVISHGVRDRDYAGIAGHLRQVGFWILSAQIGIAVTLGLTGEAVMNLIGEGFGSGTTILTLLLAAEVLYITGSISESALVYMARHRNLMLSLATLGVQVGLTLILIPAFNTIFADAPPDAAVRGVAPALALASSAAFASLIKSRFLRSLLGERVSGWRWPFFLAAGSALAVGILVQRFLPTYWELVLGLPLILATYCAILWYRGFEGSDRLLFAGRAGLGKTS